MHQNEKLYITGSILIASIIPFQDLHVMWPPQRVDADLEPFLQQPEPYPTKTSEDHIFFSLFSVFLFPHPNFLYLQKVTFLIQILNLDE